MAKTRRRGGAFEGIKKLLGFKTDAEKCADAKTAADKACAPAPITGEQAEKVADASAEASGAPPAAAPAQQTAGRGRRRRQTRRKYKAGKHRRGH